MKSRKFVIAGSIAAFGLASAAQAQDWQHHQWRGEAQGPHQEQQWRGVQSSPQQQQWQQRQWQQRQWQQRQWQAPVYQQRAYNNYAPRYEQRAYAGYAPRYDGGAQYRAYGYGGPRYYAGGYYRGHRYWVNDWASYGLYAPPYGYSWVQTDTGDMLLIALATGLIANAILAQ